MSRVLFPLASLLLLVNTPAWAWGELGHQLVGELAQRQLTPEATARVHELLRTESVPTLAGVAMWADHLRASDPERFKATASWHYVNIHDRSCRFVASRDCPDGACVLGAIDAQSRLLRDPAQPFEVRRDALKFIVHFVGDVHQPLHSSNRPDKGANEFQISLRTDIPPEAYARERYKNGIMSTNLHAVWDYYVLASEKLQLGEYADRLAAASRPPTPQSSPAEWALDSCELIDQRAIYPRSHKMDAKYLNAMRPLAEQRIVQAADRLARLLNVMFASQSAARP
jgi:nuclease S1